MTLSENLSVLKICLSPQPFDSLAYNYTVVKLRHKYSHTIYIRESDASIFLHLIQKTKFNCQIVRPRKATKFIMNKGTLQQNICVWMKYKVYTVERWSSAFETWLACLFLYDFFRVWAILCTQSLQQRHQPAQNFWVHSEFLGFFVLYSRPLADFLSHLGKWVRLIKFEAENEFFLHLEGWKPTKYHIYTLILQCSCH